MCKVKTVPGTTSIAGGCASAGIKERRQDSEDGMNPPGSGSSGGGSSSSRVLFAGLWNHDVALPTPSFRTFQMSNGLSKG